MTSILSDIYNSLEALTVTYTDKTGASVSPAVFSQETALDSVQTAHLPCRLLFPAQGSFTINPGGIQFAEWRIADLALLEAAGQGTGQRDEIPQMTRYLMAYTEKIGTLWQYVSGWSTEDRSISATVTSGKFEYPSQSGNWWYGVRCELIINETI